MIDHAAMLALNTAHETETSPLDSGGLNALLGAAFHYEAVAGGRDGFLIAFDQNAAYESVNFQWFKARRQRFVYIDRVIISPHARGQGLARGLYERLIIKARAAGHDRIGCELNLDPPNPGSAAFHAALGFAAVGQARLANGKLVEYQELPL
jgi:uncharacterized protein